MKLVTYTIKDKTSIGWIQEDGIVDIPSAHHELPDNMLAFIDNHETYFEIIKSLGKVETHHKLSEVKLEAPLPNPRSFRDYVCFEMHMQNASRSFGHTVGPIWYDLPIFYFTNHQAIYGHGDTIPKPPLETKLDIELEMACIIGKKGKNISKEAARPYIFGYTVFNDWTARSIQKIEMGGPPLGPHKGKDFANAIGPCIVTADEMEQYRIPLDESVFVDPIKVPAIKGDRFNVKMSSRINGQTICEGNFKTIHFNFEQMIERASENGVNLMPGDILGSGTVGWGSLIENNFSVHRPLEIGDVVELEIEGIGVLKNTVG